MTRRRRRHQINHTENILVVILVVGCIVIRRRRQPRWGCQRHVWGVGRMARETNQRKSLSQKVQWMDSNVAFLLLGLFPVGHLQNVVVVVACVCVCRSRGCGASPKLLPVHHTKCRGGATHTPKNRFGMVHPSTTLWNIASVSHWKLVRARAP